MGFKKCPRCDLNYIPDTETYCDVCKAELKLDPSRTFVEFNDDADQILCPVCKRNFMDADDEMCAECRDARSNSFIKSEEVDPEEDDSWRDYIDEDEKEAISNKSEDGEEVLSLEQLGDDEVKELFDDEEEDEDDYYDDKTHDDFEDDFEEDFKNAGEDVNLTEEDEDEEYDEEGKEGEDEEEE